MPNWTTNSLTAEGVENMDIFNAEGDLDFNKIIPMPETIRDTVAGSMEEPSILAYLTKKFSEGYDGQSAEDLKKISGLLKGGTFAFSGESISRERWEELRKRARDGSLSTDRAYDKAYRDGERYVKNIREYGFADWYGWACANWGVKWNASCTRIPCRGVVAFDTPWGPPLKVIAALSAQHPGVTFALEWQDEDTPFLTEGVEFLNGEAGREYSEEDDDLKAEWEEVTGLDD